MQCIYCESAASQSCSDLDDTQNVPDFPMLEILTGPVNWRWACHKAAVGSLQFSWRTHSGDTKHKPWVRWAQSQMLFRELNTQLIPLSPLYNRIWISRDDLLPQLSNNSGSKAWAHIKLCQEASLALLTQSAYKDLICEKQQGEPFFYFIVLLCVMIGAGSSWSLTM